MIDFLKRLVDLLFEGFVHALAVAFIFAWILSDRIESGLWVVIATGAAWVFAAVLFSWGGEND